MAPGIIGAAQRVWSPSFALNTNTHQGPLGREGSAARRLRLSKSPTRIELWVDGDLAGGAEEWWDSVEAALAQSHPGACPLLSRVDPYGDAVFDRDGLRALADELRELALNAPESSQAFIARLIELCNADSMATNADVRFLGD